MQRTPVIDMPAVNPIPNGYSWHKIDSNVHVEDTNELLNIPFLGDTVIECEMSFLEEVAGNYGNEIFKNEADEINDLVDLVDSMKAHQFNLDASPSNKIFAVIAENELIWNKNIDKCRHKYVILMRKYFIVSYKFGFL